MWGGENLMLENNGVAGASASKVLDRRVFVASGSNKPFGDYNLNVLYGPTATRYPAVPDTNFGINAGEGAGPIEQIVNGALTGVSGSLGWVLTGGFSRSREAIYMEGLNVDRVLYPDFNVSAYNLPRATGWTYRAMVKVGGNWYTSVATIASIGFSTANGDFPTMGEKCVFQVNEATKNDWTVLTVTEGTSLSRSTTAVTLPAGNIQGYGFYNTTSTTANGFRLDALQLEANPTQKIVVPRNAFIVYQEQPSIDNSVNPALATWYLKADKKATVDTLITCNMTGADTAQKTATMLAGTDTASFQTNHTKTNVAQKVTCEVVTGGGYVTGANAKQEVTVGAAEEANSAYGDTAMYGDTTLYGG